MSMWARYRRIPVSYVPLLGLHVLAIFVDRREAEEVLADLVEGCALGAERFDLFAVVAHLDGFPPAQTLVGLVLHHDGEVGSQHVMCDLHFSPRMSGYVAAATNTMVAASVIAAVTMVAISRSSTSSRCGRRGPPPPGSRCTSL
eukprot:GHVR01126155.1.p1 GENE.GHVR01126155.1~~GHVR01126155.1.p1  ORF type:complete len:144 (-),score=20.63 GHVR01126155.1:189-620(-)